MRNINSWFMVILKLIFGILKLEYKGVCVYIYVLLNILGILKKVVGIFEWIKRMKINLGLYLYYCN